MKILNILCVITAIATSFIITGCRRSGGEVWEDTKSCSRHVGRGVKTLGGKHGDSRQVMDRDDFYSFGDDSYMGPMESDFIPLQDDNGNPMMTMQDANYRAPRESPGDPGSSLPGIESFRDPSTIPELAGLFQNIYFELNSSLIKGPDNLKIVRDIAGYLRTHPNTYIFVEGHTDERGPEAFNLALGSHRSNSVRNLLIQDGVNPDNIFTISYGKEKPVMMDHHEEAWSLNRRAEFKVYLR